MLSLEGKQLGNYDVIRRIRVGGMGAVYEGRQRTAFDRRVAIKVILGNYANDRDMRRRFAREARTVARLHHPHILPLIEFGDEDGILYLVMPFIDGGTLTSYLRNSLPDLNEVSAIYQQLLDAVEYAHDEGLIHRDIKSSNVLLELRRNGAPYVYLADFGLVRTSKQQAAEQVGKPIPLDQVPGTPHYMAPEQTLGIVTTLTDIYALGVLLFQMLTGELPYNDQDDVRVIQMHLSAPIPSPCDHDASIPREMAEVVRTAMAKRPEERFANVGELRAAFLNALKGPAISTPLEESPIVEESVPPRRHLSIPLAQQESPAPIVMPMRPRNETLQRTRQELPQRNNYEEHTPVVVWEKQRITTDNFKPKQRITEEPVRKRSKQKRRPVFLLTVVAVVVPLLLLALVLMPRVLGVSFFPSGFPLLGTPPVATVYITAQSKVLEDNYVLTASSKFKNPDVVAHTLPSRLLQSNASGGSTVQTTGGRTLAGTRSQGQLFFINPGNTTITVNAQTVFTAVGGVEVVVTQPVTIAPRQNGQDGKGTAPAAAVQIGAAGNIAAGALNAPCCNGLTVRNPQAFSGGTDGQSLRIVAQSDLDGVQNTLAPKLQQQIVQQIQKRLGPDEAIAGQPSFQVNVTSDNSVGAQVDQVRVQIDVVGSVQVYNRKVATDISSQLLTRRAKTTLSSGYQVVGNITTKVEPTVEQGKDGIIYLHTSARGQWQYNFSQQQVNSWQQSIKGATSPVALAYLNEQPGVAAVEIRLPFGADRLPSSSDDIRIVTVGG